MLNGKTMIIHLIVGLIKKTLYKMSQYFPKLYKPLEETSILKLIYLIMKQNRFKKGNRN